jgi:hypothetical protein
MHTRACVLITASLLLALATPALASDGVLEINQTCAVETGCFAGDAPGFPVTIFAAGSYRLTSNLTMPDSDTGGIELYSSDVSIDLNGFEIAGVVTCSGTPTTCTPGFNDASGSGIQGGVIGSDPDRVAVRNGLIRGMGGAGIVLGSNSRVSNVVARSNGRTGISVRESSIVESSIAERNGFDGISAFSSSVSDSVARLNAQEGFDFSGTVINSTATGNGRNGFRYSRGSTLTGVSAFSNDGDGITPILPSDSATIRGATAESNMGSGIKLGDGSVLRASVARLNQGNGVEAGANTLISDCAASNNGGNGILAGAGSSVQRSISRGNTGGEGLNLDATATYQNVTTGTVSGGINMGGNSCNGTPTCP